MSKIALKQGPIRVNDDNNDPDEIEDDEEEEEEEEEEDPQDSEEETESESEKESVPSDNEEQLEEIAESDTSDSDTESETEETENDEDDDNINGIKPIDTQNTKHKNSFKVNKKQKNQVKSSKLENDDANYYIEDDDIENESDDDNENYLQKFDESIRQNIIAQYHPEMIIKNSAEIETLSRVVRNANGNIIDPFHKTLPFLTKYEKARILGERANQINEGSPIFVKVDPDVIDGYLIALKEFEERKIPFIIQRPIPDGTCEYWKLSDLEII